MAETKATGRGLGWKEGNVREDGAPQPGDRCRKRAGQGRGHGEHRFKRQGKMRSTLREMEKEKEHSERRRS